MEGLNLKQSCVAELDLLLLGLEKDERFPRLISSLYQMLPGAFSIATSKKIANYCYSSVHFARGMAFYMALCGAWLLSVLEHLLIAV